MAMKDRSPRRTPDRSTSQRKPQQPHAFLIAKGSLPPASLQRKQLDPKALSPSDVLQLQRTAGNRAVNRLLADSHAAQRLDERIRTAAFSAGESERKLPGIVQQKMETTFGADLSDIRLREGQAAPSIGALAYTQGGVIHFAPGQYQPHSQSGQKLLGHELAHVIQQRTGQAAAPQSQGAAIINADPQLEKEADGIGARAARGEKVSDAQSLDVSHNGSTASSPIQPMFGFELEMRVMLSTKPPHIPDSTAQPEDYSDPQLGKNDVIYKGREIKLVEDHGNSLSSFQGEHKKGGYTSILEIVTDPIDESMEMQAAARRPMQEAVNLAQQIETQTTDLKRRVPMSQIVAPLRPHLYAGLNVDTSRGDAAFQTTDAGVQVTYGTKLGSVPALMSAIEQQRAPADREAIILRKAQQAAGTLVPAVYKSLLRQDLYQPLTVPTTAAKLKGLLHILAMYLLGGSAEFGGGGLDKNIVPLLVRHPIHQAFQAFNPTELGDFQTRVNQAHLQTALLKATKRDAGEPLFPGTQHAITCGAWVTGVFQQTGDPLAAAWGQMKIVPPESVGPLFNYETGAVFEERRAIQPNVPRSSWQGLADQYYTMLSGLNQ